MSEDNVMVDAEKVGVIKEFSPPITVKEVRTFIGMYITTKGSFQICQR